MAKLLYPMTEKDFFTMAQCSIHSQDIDPVYPILKAWFDDNKIDYEGRLWCDLLYVYCYNLPWTLSLFVDYPSLEIAYNKKIWEDIRLPIVKIGSDRRGIYWSGGLALALKNLVDSIYICSTVADYLDTYSQFEYETKDEDEIDYLAVNRAIRNLPMGGAWSAFKYSDLITQTIDEIDCWCTDLFVRERLAGPGEAILALLGQDTKNHQWIKDNYDIVKFKLNEWTKEIGYLTGLNYDITWFETETVLCNYHSICVGSYYLGADLDSMFESIKDKEKKYKLEETDKSILSYRKKIFKLTDLIEGSNRIARQDIKQYRIKCYTCESGGL